MHAAFSTIQFGPFQTSYHRGAVNDEFRESLNDFLERELLPQVDEPFNRTQGKLTAEFNEEKYCGPNSAVRDAYRLKFAFIREGSSDEIEAQVYREAKTGFRMRYRHQSLTLWTRKRKEEARAFRAAIDDMVSRIQADEHGDWTCPRCSTRLSLIDSPHLFDLSCPERCFNYNYHRDPKTKEFLHGHFFSKPTPHTKANAEPCAGANGRGGHRSA